MRAGNVAQRINQRQHHETKRQRNANVRDGAVAHVVDHNCSRPGEDEEERPEQFRRQFLHILVESDTHGKRPSTARWEATKWAHLDTTTNIRGSAKRNAAFTLQHGAMLTPRQPEGCVPVVVSRCAPRMSRRLFGIETRSLCWHPLARMSHLNRAREVFDIELAGLKA